MKLHCAASWGKVEQIKECLKSGNFKVDDVDDGGDQAIHVGTEKGRVSVVQALLDLGANINAETPDLQTPLHIAVQREHIEMVQLLIAHGADVNAENRRHQRPLHFAASRGNLLYMRLLLENGASADARDANGLSALNELLQSTRWVEKEYCSLDAVHLLIDHGADLNAPDRFLHTHISHAVEHQNESVVRLLVERGANIHVQTCSGETLLHRTYWKDMEVLKLLLSLGLDVNAIEREERLVPLHHAVLKSEANLAGLMLDHGADIDAQDASGETPIFRAVNDYPSRHSAIVRLLLERGADIQLPDNSGRSPLHAAVLRAHEDCIKLLLQYRADPNARDALGNTPLHFAAMHGRIKIATQLLECGANLHIRNREGHMPFEEALQNGHTRCAASLR